MGVRRANHHTRLGCDGDFNEGFSHVRSPTETILNIVLLVAMHVVYRTTLYATFFREQNREGTNKRGVVIVGPKHVFAT